MAIDTKTALLDSAEQAARTRGFDAFSYKDLADAVGIRKASVHHHFPTKAALSVALIERYCANFETACINICAIHNTGATRVAALMELYRNALDGGKSLCLCVSFSTSCESLPPEVSIRISRFRRLIVAWLADAFEKGQLDGTICNVSDPIQEASATLPLLEGAQLAARSQGDPYLFDQSLQLLGSRLN
jgi:TetR/AcrR family transcriptional repressor of nem operon